MTFSKTLHLRHSAAALHITKINFLSFIFFYHPTREIYVKDNYFSNFVLHCNIQHSLPASISNECMLIIDMDVCQSLFNKHSLSNKEYQLFSQENCPKEKKCPKKVFHPIYTLKWQYRNEILQVHIFSKFSGVVSE